MTGDSESCQTVGHMLLQRGQIVGLLKNYYSPDLLYNRLVGISTDVLPLLLLFVVGARGPRVVMTDGRLAKKWESSLSLMSH